MGSGHICLRGFLGNQIDQEIGRKDRKGQKVKRVENSIPIGNKPAYGRRKAGKKGLNAKEGADGSATDALGSQVHHPGQDNRLQGKQKKAQDAQNGDEKIIQAQGHQSDEEQARDEQPRRQDGPTHLCFCETNRFDRVVIYHEGTECFLTAGF